MTNFHFICTSERKKKMPSASKRGFALTFWPVATPGPIMGSDADPHYMLALCTHQWAPPHFDKVNAYWERCHWGVDRCWCSLNACGIYKLWQTEVTLTDDNEKLSDNLVRFIQLLTSMHAHRDLRVWTRHDNHCTQLLLIYNTQQHSARLCWNQPHYCSWRFSVVVTWFVAWTKLLNVEPG